MPKRAKSKANHHQQQQQQQQQQQHFAKGSDSWSRLKYSQAIEAYFNKDYLNQAIILTEFLVNTPPEHDLYVAAALRLSEGPSLKSLAHYWDDINGKGLSDRAANLADSNVHVLPAVIFAYILFQYHLLSRIMDDAVLEKTNLSDHAKHKIKGDPITMNMPVEIITSLDILTFCGKYRNLFQSNDPKFICPDPSNLRQDILVPGIQLISLREDKQLMHLRSLGLLSNKDTSLLDNSDFRLVRMLGSIMLCYIFCSTCKRQPPPDAPFMKCGGCRLKRYCSAQCQRVDWNGGHKAVCRSREDIEEGDIVRVSGLVQASHLNGVFFILKRRAQSAGRWMVAKLGDSKEYSIKEENLTRVATALELSVPS